LGIGSKRLGQHLLSVALRGIHGFAPVQDEIRTQPELSHTRLLKQVWQK